MSSVPSNYYNILAEIESGNNPNAKNPSSSASGLYQFVRKTWENLGYNWNQVFNVDLQNQAVRIFTNNNAKILERNGIDVNNLTLYGAHFLGIGNAIKVFGSNASDYLSSILPKSVLNANPQLQNMTVGDFFNWLNGKVGGVADAANPANVAKGVTDAVGLTGPNSLLGFLTNLFSYNTATRFAAVVIGVILIAVAIAAFALSSDTVKEVVKSVPKVPA